jgi:hypothetical protein
MDNDDDGGDGGGDDDNDDYDYVTTLKKELYDE